VLCHRPHCWQPTAHGDYLKPDSYCVLVTTTHEDSWWLEIDQATESLPRIRTEARIYLDHLTHGGLGPENVPPRVLFTTPTTQRYEAIKNVIAQLSIQDNHLINVTTRTGAPEFLIRELLAA
jgi:Replication-relaxation